MSTEAATARPSQSFTCRSRRPRQWWRPSSASVQRAPHPPCSVACPAGIDVPSFVGALAETGPAKAGRDDPGRESPRRHLRPCLPVELLCEGACVLAHEASPPIRSPRSSASRRTGPSRKASSSARYGHSDRKARRRDRAGPAGWPARKRLAALGHAVEVYDSRREVGGLVDFGIAPYRQQVDPLPDEARLVESSAWRSGSERRSSRPRRSGASKMTATLSSSPSAWAPTSGGGCREASCRRPGARSSSSRR